MGILWAHTGAIVCIVLTLGVVLQYKVFPIGCIGLICAPSYFVCPLNASTY